MGNSQVGRGKYNTQTVMIGFIEYCVYCGEKAKEDCDYDEYTRYEYHSCNCDGAKADKELQKFHEKLLPRLKEATEKINRLKYENEVKQLKYKYNI